MQDRIADQEAEVHRLRESLEQHRIAQEACAEDKKLLAAARARVEQLEHQVRAARNVLCCVLLLSYVAFAGLVAGVAAGAVPEAPGSRLYDTHSSTGWLASGD